MRSFTTIVLAGSRPGPDPLTAGTGLSSKALLPIAGIPMLAYVLRSLAATPQVGRIIVMAQDVEALANNPAIAAAAKVEWRVSRGSIADAIHGLLADTDGPLLVTSADNVLLTPAIAEQFVAATSGCDLAIGMVERERVRSAGHSTKRTWLAFRGGKWSGANLFWLGGSQVDPFVSFWSAVEQDRKKGLKIIGAFGPGLLLGAVLRLMDIHTFARRAGQRFGLDARIVSLDAPEACIDADKPADLPVIETILASRQAAASA
ncbi:MAG: NTP transferase domain-containing protein [Sphingomonadaceae bacterium]|nr:NTP transferase domain-containing protein [Sphingomonadaceae bacterium]